MKTAVIFPGQGSQYVGMGHDFYKKYYSSKEIYEELDQLLERNITDLIFSGNEAELSKTENSQPAIMATSVAILKALYSENLLSSNSFEAVAGHSLGEYTSLVANESIGFKESVKLLKARSKAMQESMPLGTGGMIALIGCQKEIIKEVIKSSSKYGKIYEANDNAIGQVVLSGEIKAIHFILENVKKLGIRKAIKLPVSAPFHCELMMHASDVMKEELNDIKFNHFKVPLYSNVTSDVCTEVDIADLLVTQVISKVRWREIVENMIQAGFNNFIEIGPGNVLTNLVKRTSKNINAYSISTVDDLEKISNIRL